jgi:hypothetical protein
VHLPREGELETPSTRTSIAKKEAVQGHFDSSGAHIHVS